MIIAIDGPAAAGKGTIAKLLAQHFNFAFLDTGALYRATALKLLQEGADPHDEDKAEAAALSLKDENLYQLLANPALRSEETGSAASIVSAQTRVRQALFAVQRNFATAPYFADGTPAKGAVLDGRDIGTTICPDAEVKLFITASDEIRAQRRFKELQSQDKSVIYDQVLADLQARDARDSGRATAPLRVADGAFVLDTSDLSIDEATAKAKEYATPLLKTGA